MNFVVDDIGTVVNSMRPLDNSYGNGMIDYLTSIGQNENNDLKPFYMYGHRLEISNRLLDKDKDMVYKYQKYPLIALRMDFPERVVDGMWQYTLNLAILTYTEKNYNAEERYTNVFKPVLYPLYERFLKVVRESGLFTWPGDQEYIPHTKYDRPFWGISEREGNSKNIFNDPLDAIELVDLKLNQRIKNC